MGRLVPRTVRLSEEVWRRLDRLARSQGLVGASQLIRVIVYRYLHTLEEGKGESEGREEQRW